MIWYVLLACIFPPIILVWVLMRLCSKRPKDVTNKVVLVTGGAQGIGHGIANEFVKLGARVVIWDLQEEKAQKAAAELNRGGEERVYAFGVDVSNPKAVYSTAARVTEQVGPVDILVNNAGIVSGAFLEDISDARIKTLFGVNTLAHFWTLKAFLPSMMQRREGHVVTVSSLAALGGAPKMTDYCASKAAVASLTEALRRELKMRGFFNIHTTNIMPYYVSTGMFEGVHGIIPMLTPQAVVARVMRAVLCNEHDVVLPSWLHSIHLLKFLLPAGVQDRVCNWLGITHSMDHFVGHGKQK